MKIIEGPNGLKIFQVDAPELRFVLEFKEIEVVFRKAHLQRMVGHFRIDC
jgi:hypothetical protein